MSFMEKVNWKLYRKFNYFGLDEQTAKRLMNYNFKFWMFIWFIARSILIIYVFTVMIYNRVGFEKTLIAAVVIMNMLLWYNMRLMRNPFDRKNI